MLYGERSGATPDDELVECVHRLHELCQSRASIARRLHISTADVKHILATGELPKRQSRLQWKEVGDEG